MPDIIESVEFIVQVTNDILDLEKHSTVSFREPQKFTKHTNLGKKIGKIMLKLVSLGKAKNKIFLPEDEGANSKPRQASVFL